MSTTPITLAIVNDLSRDAFVAALGPLFEGSPWIAAATWPARPFASIDQLHQALCATMYAAPIERQVALIQAHPDLAGKAAIAGELTADSAREQSSAGLSRLAPEQFATFTRLNQAYREKFGFPFVICAREHSASQHSGTFRHPAGAPARTGDRHRARRDRQDRPAAAAGCRRE